MDESQPNVLMKSPVADAVGTTPKAAAKPAPPTPTAARKRGTSDEKKPQPNKMRRRLIWTAVWAYLAANFVMFLRFFFPRALFEPSTVHTIGFPSDYSLGVDERFKQLYRL